MQKFLPFFGTVLFFFVPVFGQKAESKSIRDIATPKGCVREEYPKGSYQEWLRDLDLKPDPRIFSYSGTEIKRELYNVHSVIAKPLLFENDLEQCADWGMRFWADYHRDSKNLSRLYLYNYSGKKRYYSSSGKDYLSFLKVSFDETNSWSVKKGAKTISEDKLVPGDMILQNENGGVGHLSVLMDSCSFADGKRLFLIGYSFMPAQEFHIERNPNRKDGWYDISSFVSYLKEYFPYGEPVFRRF
ncbi:DUF4846 domain-containing protein [Leptospira andrefontaineae]|uniref:Lipoprotein n=1 Tax=Leptospira andrefontaineae TaxID=2484976 RepID=A0A4R9H4L4_9LEPT|nr:DUF4846 domain-containing protein [Leptospira andrefontaineae]TGK39805.1 hypothetical protein EHO65_11450 [Leptospira andrefontaineae]